MAISLEKGKKVNLRKQEKVGLGEILVNLNWNNKPAKKGFLGSLFGGGSKPIDLDLGCLYELKNGRKGTVQALGNAFGSLQQEPYIALDGDDRTQTAISKVQLDILAAKFPDPIIDAVTDLLYGLELPYSDQGSSYDPDYGCFRTILQTEVA